VNAPKKVEAESLAQAMALAFAEIESATKSTSGQVGRQLYKYADLTSVIEAIKPALVKHNLFFTQHAVPNERGAQIETVLHHANGEKFALGSLFVPSAANNAQGFGSALTYARRYALVTAFGVPVEDDDGKAASQPRQQAPQEETDTPAGRAEYPFPEGPASGISQLKDMVRPIWRDLMSCGDLDELEGCIEAHKAVIQQASRLTNPTHRTQLWEGDGKDNPGLSGVIRQQRDAFGGPTILQAG
jgi:ERF superfamily